MSWPAWRLRARKVSSRPKRLFELVPVLRGDADMVELVQRLDVDRVMLAPGLSESQPASRGRL
jgi:hypothetical protein